MFNLRSLISILAISSFAVFVNYANAVWMAPTLSPTGDNTPQAINVGTAEQTKLGGLNFGSLLVRHSGWFPSGGTGQVSGRIGVGIAPDATTSSPETVVMVGDVKAPSFCLSGSCISRWQDGFVLSGGSTNALVKWLSPTTIGASSAVSEAPVATGAVASGASGLKLKGLANLTAAQRALLQNKNVALSIDPVTGDVILVRTCGQ